MLEAITMCEAIAGRELHYTISEDARIGDHQWYVSDLGAFVEEYPDWSLTFGIDDVLRDIHEHNVDQWLAASVTASS
jgi:CDP-paratose 2-epimerase